MEKGTQCQDCILPVLHSFYLCWQLLTAKSSVLKGWGRSVLLSQHVQYPSLQMNHSEVPNPLRVKVSICGI